MSSCILFAECNILGQAAYEGLLANSINVSRIYCQNPKRFKAGNSIFSASLFQRKANPFAQLVASNSAEVEAINRPFKESLKTVIALTDTIDFILVAGSGIIFSEDFLRNLRVPIINLHPALLPAYRGPMPIQALVLNDDADRFGGMTAHVLVAGIDAGPIIKQNAVSASKYKSLTAWEHAVYSQCDDLIRNGVLPFVNGKINTVEQDESAATYYSLQQVPTFISEAMSFSECENFAQKAPLLFANIKLRYAHSNGDLRTIRIYGAPKRVGQRTGLPAKVGLLTIEMDLRDGRAQFKINHRLRRLKTKLARLIPRL